MVIKFVPLMFPNKFAKWAVISRAFSSISPVNYPKTRKGSGFGVDPTLKKDSNDLRVSFRVFKWESLQKLADNTPGTYYNTILKLGLAGNVEEMEEFCKKIVKCRGGKEALGSVLDVFVGEGRLDEAMRVVLVMNSSGARVLVGKWNCVLSGLVVWKRGFRDFMLVYKEMVKSGVLPDVDTLNCLIKALFDAKMVRMAVDQFRKMKKKQCVPNCRTFEIVVCGLVVDNRVDESVSVMNEMFEEGISPDLSFCNAVVPLLSKENKVEEVVKLFDVMKSLDYEPDFSTFEALIKCLCLNTRFTEAVQLYDQMKKSGMNMSADVLVDLIDACCKLGKFDKGRSLLDDNEVVDDSSPYNVMLQGYCDAHRLLPAKDLLQRMFVMNVADNRSWYIFFQALCNEKFVKQACVILGKMIVSSFVPDSTTYSAFISNKCYLRKYKEAMVLFQQLKENDMGLDPYSYTEIMTGLCKMEKFQDAAEVFEYMSLKNFTLHSSLFDCLIEGLCATATLDDATRVLKFCHYRGNPGTISAYTSIMECSLKLDKPYNSLLVLPQILRRGINLDVKAYCVLIRCMIALSRTKSSVLFFNLMISEDLVPDRETLSSLLTYFTHHSELHTIWIFIEKLCWKSQVIDSDMLNLLINGLYKEGCKTEARQLLDFMLEKGWVPDASTQSTHALLIGSPNSHTELQKLESDNFVVQSDGVR